MKRTTLEKMTTDQLVERFVEIGIAQDKAELEGDISEFNRLFDKMDAVENELKARSGDQRQALLQLYDHPNMEVRLRAAKATLAVAPGIARQALEAISASRCHPQALEAGMSLTNLDNGIFKPK